jgi:hypothetical protein
MWSAPLALPAGIRVINASIDIRAEKSHGVGDAQTARLAVHQRQELLAAIRGCDRHVPPRPNVL